MSPTPDDHTDSTPLTEARAEVPALARLVGVADELARQLGERDRREAELWKPWHAQQIAESQAQTARNESCRDILRGKPFGIALAFALIVASAGGTAWATGWDPTPVIESYLLGECPPAPECPALPPEGVP